MELKRKLRDYLGISDLQAEHSKHNLDLSNALSEVRKLNTKLEQVRDESQRLRVLIVENWSKNQPASIQAIDAIFKETRDRLDVVMVTVDQFADAMRQRR